MLLFGMPVYPVTGGRVSFRPPYTNRSFSASLMVGWL